MVASGVVPGTKSLYLFGGLLVLYNMIYSIYASYHHSKIDSIHGCFRVCHLGVSHFMPSIMHLKKLDSDPQVGQE